MGVEVAVPLAVGVMLLVWLGVGVPAVEVAVDVAAGPSVPVEVGVGDGVGVAVFQNGAGLIVGFIGISKISPYNSWSVRISSIMSSLRGRMISKSQGA